MADRMDDILRTVAGEADRGVDYAALHDAILVAHTKTKKAPIRPVRMLSYAAAFVVLLGLGALALLRGMAGAGMGQSRPDEAGYDSYTLTSGSGLPETPQANLEGATMQPAPADAARGTDDGAKDGGAVGNAAGDTYGSETEPPMLGMQITGSSASDAAGPDTLAAEVLLRENAMQKDVGLLPEPDAGMLGTSPFGGYSCSTSYNGVYIEPLEGAPKLGKAVVSDYGNGELRIYWSASETLHVYAYFIGYTIEDAVALLTKMG